METETKIEKYSVTLADAKKFISSVGIINKLVNEVVFRFTAEGLNITAMDAANIAMISFDYSKEGFLNYEAPTEEVKFGVDLTKLSAAFRRLKDGAVVIDFADRITVNGQGKLKKKFTVPILTDPEEERKKMPPLEFKAAVRVKVDDLSEAIEDATLAGESVMLSCEKGKFSLIAETEINSASTDITAIEEVISPEGVIRGKYSIEYLQKMVTTKIADEATIRFGNEYPVKIEYASENIKLSIILAPRVSND